MTGQGEAGGQESAKEMLRFLQSTTLFGGLDDAEVGHLLRGCNRRRVKGLEYIFREKEVEESLYYLLEGRVYLTRKIGEAEEFLAVLDKGDSFGEAGLMGGGMRYATVRARTDCLLLCFGKESVDELPGDIALKFVKNIALTGVEKLLIANKMIDSLYEQLRGLQDKDAVSHEEAEDKFVEGFDDPKV